jgi:hypothetical protein
MELDLTVPVSSTSWGTGPCSMFANISKFWQKKLNISKNQRKCLAKITLGNSEFSDHEIWLFHLPDEPGTDVCK